MFNQSAACDADCALQEAAGCLFCTSQCDCIQSDGGQNVLWLIFFWLTPNWPSGLQEHTMCVGVGLLTHFIVHSLAPQGQKCPICGSRTHIYCVWLSMQIWTILRYILCIYKSVVFSIVYIWGISGEYVICLCFLTSFLSVHFRTIWKMWCDFDRMINGNTTEDEQRFILIFVLSKSC